MSTARSIDWAYTHALRAALHAQVGSTLMPHQVFPDAIVDGVRTVARVEGMWGLALTGLALLGNPVDDERRAFARERAIASLVFEQRRRRLSTMLNDHGIRHAYFKGALMDALFWRGSGLRGSTDIDVLVAQRDLAAVTMLLEQEGGERIFIEDRQASLAASHARVFHWYSGGADIDVDVHVSMLDAPPFVDPASEILTAATHHQTHQGLLPGFSLDDALAWTGGKLVAGGFLDRMKLAVDAWSLLALGADLGAALERARRWRAEKGLALLLALVEKRLGSPRPELDLARPSRHLSPGTRELGAIVVGIDGPPLPLRGMPSRALFSDDQWQGARSMFRWAVLDIANRNWNTPVLALLARASSEYLSLQRSDSTSGGSFNPSEERQPDRRK